MKNKVEGLKEFYDKLDQVEKAFNKLPNEFAVIAVRFSKERFRKQNWYDTNAEAWEKLKQPRKGSRRRSQTILVDTARLKRSVRKIEANTKLIAIGSNEPYAQIQNDGGTIDEVVTVKSHTVRSHSRKAYTRTRDGRRKRVPKTTVKSFKVKSHRKHMNFTIPSRRFIGVSKKLTNEIVDHGVERFEEALK